MLKRFAPLLAVLALQACAHGPQDTAAGCDDRYRSPEVVYVPAPAAPGTIYNPAGSFDLFIIDAFTSDAIPVHMLTKEAVELFLRKLKPDGVVLLHTSNRYLDLNSVLGAIQKQLPEGTTGIAVQDAGGDGYGESGSTVVIFAKSEAALQPYRTMEGALELDDGSSTGSALRAWTDDYSDILGAFWSRYMGRG